MNRKEFIKNAGIAFAAIPSTLQLKAESLAFHSESIPNFSDWNEIAKQFGANNNIIYLNNGTMGICPDVVLEELRKSFEMTANSGVYPANMNLLKDRLSAVLGVESKTIAITKNVTEGLNIACWGHDLKRGDEVLMTTHEHVGGCAAWLYRAKTEGIVLKTFALGATAEETLQNFKKSITSNTKIIAIPHIPCTIGQILPIKEMCSYARERGIISIIDGAHPLGMLRVNIKDLGCDYYSGCLHKWLLAPLGMGFIYIHPDKLTSTKIHNLGAYSISKFDMTAAIPQLGDGEVVNETQRFSSGTYCGPLYEASIKAIEWYESIGIDRIEKRVKELSLHLHHSLAKFKTDVKILSPIEDISRGAQTTFCITSKDAEKFIGFAKNSKYKITLRHVHEGKLNAVRVSTHYYNSEEQIDSLMEVLGDYLKS
jgi:L-cysteine/cystine lyase